MPAHGGDLGFATRRYGMPEAGWLDLSTGINPEPWRVPATALAGLARLPDPAALATLVAVARTAYGAPPSAVLAAVPGSDIALRLLPLLAPPGDVAIVGVTYSGHAEAWRAAGRAVRPMPSLAAAESAAALIVLCNPNNPDGARHSPAVLRGLADRLAARGGLLVVDEAFADVAPGLSLIPTLGPAPAIVLRSFGKFFGLAGLRLGFIVGAPGIVGRLETLLGAWPVSAPAAAIGAAALADSGWQEATRQRLREDAVRLDAVLVAAGFIAAGGTDLFRLVGHGEATRMHAALAREGVWARAFPERPDRLRFGLPASTEWGRLERTLQSARRAVA